jgi:hypothetical protein
MKKFKIKNHINKSIVALIVVMLSTTGCGDFLDINTDPNNPQDVKLDLILPATEAAIFESLGNGSGGLSDLTSQFVHQTVQRNNSNFYQVTGDEFSISNAWPNLYSGALMDIKQMISKAEATKSYHYLGVAQTLKAYVYSMLVDVWGSAPYDEFGMGTENPFPTYNSGEEIYPKLFLLLDEAVANMKKESVEKITGNDFVYGSKTDRIDYWIKFANSLKLKLYNQVRLTDLYNDAAVAALITEDNFIDEMSGGFRLKYGSANNPENRHPLFVQDYVQANANYIDPYFFLVLKGFGINGQPVMNDVLEGIQDPRIPYYFYNQLKGGETPQNKTTSAKWGNFLSIWFASLNIDPNEGFDQAQSQTLVGLYPAGGAYDNGSGVTGGVASGQNAGLGGASYQRLYPYFAHLYTYAELALTKGVSLGDYADAGAIFKAAMIASFAEVNELATTKIPAVDPAPGDAKTSNDIEDYVNAVMAKYDAADDEGKLELILTEKWIASFGFSVDSYTDYRRTGYPEMFDPATDENPLTILNRNYPLSFPYYISDLQINPNAPAQRNPGFDKVFWDK